MHKIRNRDISGNVNNVIAKGDVIIKENKVQEYTEMISLLRDVINISNSNEEKKLANELIKCCEKNDRSQLKKKVVDNITALVSGTFAATAGGMLVEWFKRIIT